jgi:hypothetical protein
MPLALRLPYNGFAKSAVAGALGARAYQALGFYASRAPTHGGLLHCY